MTTTAAPIASEIVDALGGRDYRRTPNPWSGFDLATSSRIVRIAIDDTAVQIFVLEGRAQLLAASATFSNTPASIIASVVASYLAA